jgi:hypothetical protein
MHTLSKFMCLPVETCIKHPVVDPPITKPILEQLEGVGIDPLGPN